MARVLTFLLLLAAPLAGADQTRLRVSATILARCQTSAVGIVHCGPGARVPYRMTRDGQVLVVEF